MGVGDLVCGAAVINQLCLNLSCVYQLLHIDVRHNQWFVIKFKM